MSHRQYRHLFHHQYLSRCFDENKSPMSLVLCLLKFTMLLWKCYKWKMLHFLALTISIPSTFNLVCSSRFKLNKIFKKKSWKCDFIRNVYRVPTQNRPEIDHKGNRLRLGYAIRLRKTVWPTTISAAESTFFSLHRPTSNETLCSHTFSARQTFIYLN